jgi:hypothetical protein
MLQAVKIDTEVKTVATINGQNVDYVLEEAAALAHSVLEELSVWRQQHNMSDEFFSCEAQACQFLDLIGD